MPPLLIGFARWPCVISLAMLSGLSSSALAQRVADWQMVEDVRIGTDPSATYILEAIQFLLPDPQGRLYVADPRECTVLVFDSDGSFVTAIGRKGLGPGEYQTINGLGWLGDTLWVADRSRMQVTFLNSSGSVLATHRMPGDFFPADRRPARVSGLISDGSIVAVPDPAPYEPGDPLMQEVPLLAFGFGSERPDTLGMLRRQPSTVSFSARGYARSTMMGVPRNDDRWAIAPDGSLLVIAAADYSSNKKIIGFTVKGIASNGESLYTRRFPHDPVDVTDDERSRIHAGFANRIVSSDPAFSRSAAVRLARNILPVEDTRHIVSSLFVGADGRIWFHRRDQPDVFQILDPNTGMLAGTAELPQNTNTTPTGVIAADDKYVWMVERDEYAIPYIVRYRLEPVRAPTDEW